MNRTEVESDRGAVLLLFALLLVALLGLSAIVVDLGLARVERRENQAAADLAALDAGVWLSGRAAATAAIRPRAACEAAFRSVTTNLEGLPSGSAIDCSPLPVIGANPACHNGSSPTTVTASGTAPFTVSVTYPVPSSAISVASFGGGVGVNDGTQCERMEVEVRHARETFFAGVLGFSEVETHASAVVRGGTVAGQDKVPAFLILARTQCRVLTNSAGGAGNLGIIVGAPTADQGGSIRTDTDTSQCGGNSTDYGIFGDPLSGGGTSITVEDAANGALGAIESYAVTVGSGRAAAQYPGGISHPATASGITSRQPVDDRYNPSTRPAVSQLHDQARSRVMWSAATAIANGYTVLGCGDVTGTWVDTRVFVDCGSWSPDDVRLPNATDVVANGQIGVANNKLLHLPVVERFYVRGCPGCTGGNFFGVSVAGELYVNTGAEPIGGASCANREGPGAGGANTNTTRLVIFGSPFEISGQAYLCQTTVYLAADRASYTRESDELSLPNCTATKPCPVSTGAPGSYINVFGFADWQAPNQTSVAPSATQPLEDLALWTETSDVTEVKSGGVMLTTGVFFAPNARMEFRSPASGLPRNAQMIVASFQLLQGTLRLAPAPSDAVSVESSGELGLIR